MGDPQQPAGADDLPHKPTFLPLLFPGEQLAFLSPLPVCVTANWPR